MGMGACRIYLQYVIVPWLCLETQCLVILLVDYTSSQLGIVVIYTTFTQNCVTEWV